MSNFDIKKNQGGEVVISDLASSVRISFVEGDASTLRTESDGSASATEVLGIAGALVEEAYKTGLLVEGSDDTLRKRVAREAVGRQIKEARTSAGLTLRQLAEKTGIAFNHIGRIEAGRYNVTVDTLAILSGVLGKAISIPI